MDEGTGGKSRAEKSGGGKQAYKISNPKPDWLWIAGIWEENPETGKFYSKIQQGTFPMPKWKR
jgi:putative SOS response-associated peptidase YedK